MIKIKMKNRGFIAAILLLCALPAQAQVSPLGGTAFQQYLDNNGTVLTNGVLYSYAAGTTTQQATYTDSSGTTQNPNPIPLTTGGRLNVWLLTGSFYKLVLCSQNDGAFCAAGDILASADQIPGGSTSSGGVATSPFISATASPATSGILRLASSDTVCWRNAAGSANLCWSKDSSDLLSWAGGSIKFPEVAPPSCPISSFVLWSNNSNHRPQWCSNGGSATTFVGLAVGAVPGHLAVFAANSIDIQDGGVVPNGVSEALMVSNTPGNGSVVACAAGTGNCPIYFLANAHTLTRFLVNTSTAPSGCSPNAVFGIKDLTSSTVLASFTPTITGVLDSGVLSVAMTAGHQFTIGITTAAAGCGTFVAANATATYQ